MGRPLNKHTLSLLRPTANVSATSSELPATVLRQKSSIGFIVQTADGESLCTLTADDPQPGQMRLAAFDQNGSSYYVTDISKELITIQHGTGNTIPSGSEIGWNLTISDDQSLVLANKTGWNWLSIDGNDTGVWGYTITSDKSMYIWGYTNNDNNNTIMKLSPTGTVEWSTKVVQNYTTSTLGVSGIPGYYGESYLTNSDSTLNVTYFAKINSKGEIMWQKQGNVYNGASGQCYLMFTDSQNNFYAAFDAFATNTVLKFDTNGNIVYQKTILPAINYGINLRTSCVLSDDSFIIVPYSMTYNNPKEDFAMNFIRFNPEGDIINKFAICDSINPINTSLTSYIIKQDLNSNLICGGSSESAGLNYAFLTKLSTAGQILWQKGYSNYIENYPGFVDLVFDSDNNIYGVYTGDSTIITKWNNDGDLIWQIKIVNIANDLYWNGTVTSFQLIDNYLYAEFYRYGTGIYDQQFVIKINKDNPELGSFTEPYQYDVTDAADDGFGVMLSNLITTTSNVSVENSNHTFEQTSFTQENITVNYEFGF